MDHLRAVHFYRVHYMLAYRRELLDVSPTATGLIHPTGKASTFFRL
jgi:hypothetical protein